MTTSPPSNVGARRSRRSPYSQQELLDVIVRVFIERGYDATSMEDLARATGRTKSSIYHHVNGKEHLLEMAIARAIDALFAVLDEHESANGAALGRLEHVVRRSAQVLADQLPYVTLLLRVRGNTPVERAALARRRSFDQRLSALVQLAIDEGDVRADMDPRLVTRLVFGMVNSLTEWYRPGEDDDRQQVEDTLLALAFEGLRLRA